MDPYEDHEKALFVETGADRESRCDYRCGRVAHRRDADGGRPGQLDYYLEITGFTEEFEEILKAQRAGKARQLP